MTRDKDFGELVYRSGLARAGVLLRRMEAARTAEKVAVATDILANHAAELPDHFAVYQNGKLRNH